MKPGTVIHHKKFKISDGNIDDKLLVILNYQRGGEFLALLTTSQQRNRKKLEGCQSDLGYYFCPANKNWFEKAYFFNSSSSYTLIKPSRFGIFTLDKVLAFISSFSPIILLRYKR